MKTKRRPILSLEDISAEYRDFLIERFWKYAVKLGTDECWQWIGAKKTTGYGHLSFGTKNERFYIYTHRLSFLIHKGSIPSDRPYVRHRCNNPECWNPSHLLPGSHAENMQDMARSGRSNAGKNFPSFQGELHHQAKLNTEQVREIRRRLACGDSRRVLAREFGVSRTAIKLIEVGKNWRGVA